MSQEGRQPSLQELVGAAGNKSSDQPQFGLDDLKDILGEKMPDLSYDRVGQVRLVNALHQRFGVEYMNVPGVKNIMTEFEKEMKINSVIKANRGK